MKGRAPDPFVFSDDDQKEFEQFKERHPKVEVLLDCSKISLTYQAELFFDLINFFKQDAEASKRTEALNRIEEQSEQGQLNTLREKIQQQKPLQLDCHFKEIEIIMPFASLNSRVRNEAEPRRGRFWQLLVLGLSVESLDNTQRE